MAAKKQEPDDRKVMYLIDGHAQFFRAYHAIRTPMSSPVTGEPTNATFGFVGMLLKVLRDKHPDYIAVAIDASGDRGTFRSQIFSEYKANRPEPPEDLRPQVERCVDVLRTAGVPVLAIEEVEADDTIATLARRLTNEHDDVLVRIVSKDKDLMQLLVTNRIELYDPYKDEIITADSLIERIGVQPEQVIDLLSLVGDPVDNVPGVEGIGMKTAATLLETYGRLDDLLAHADDIKGKRGERLRAASETLQLSRQLVTLRDNVDVELNLDDADVRALHLERLEPVLRELGFNRHRDDLLKLTRADAAATADASASESPAPDSLFAQAASDTQPATNANYTCIRTKAELDELVNSLKAAPLFAIDTETTGIHARICDLCGVSVSTEPETGAYIPIRSPEPDTHLDLKTVLDVLRPVLEDPAIKKCGHNLKYDMIVLRNHGVLLRGIDFDSYIASFLIDSSRSSHSMDALALALLNHSCIPISDLIGTGKKQRTFDTVPLETATIYAAEDADITLQLHADLAPKLKAMGLNSLFTDVELPLVDVLAELEWNGVLVDPDELDRQAERLNARLDELREEINDAAPHPFNPDSPKQLSAILFNPTDHPNEPGLGLKPVKKTKTGLSTDVEVLEKLAADDSIESTIPSLILEHRQLAKLVGTYLVALKHAINPETKRVHASFHQTGAATGRLSSSDPNLQNIPIRTELGRAIRKAFVAPPGRVLITADYSQIELRMLAHLSRDEALLRAFREGADIHRAVAAEIHDIEPDEVTSEQRSGAKMVNFGIIYGITPYGLARRLGVSNEAATTIIADYKARFPSITTFLEECVEQARSHGYVETILKRRRAVPQIAAKNPQQRALGERIAINSVVQGSAADLIKLAMVDLHRRLSPGAASWRLEHQGDESPQIDDVLMLIQIHDELVFEAPENTATETCDLVVERMTEAMQLDAPLVVDAAISSNWFEGK